MWSQDLVGKRTLPKSVHNFRFHKDELLKKKIVLRKKIEKLESEVKRSKNK